MCISRSSNGNAFFGGRTCDFAASREFVRRPHPSPQSGVRARTVYMRTAYDHVVGPLSVGSSVYRKRQKRDLLILIYTAWDLVYTHSLPLNCSDMTMRINAARFLVLSMDLEF